MLSPVIIACIAVCVIFIALFYKQYRFNFEFNYKFAFALLPYLVFSIFFINLINPLIQNFYDLYLVVFNIPDLVFALRLVATILAGGVVFWIGLIVSDSFNQISYRKTGLFGIIVLSLIISIEFLFELISGYQLFLCLAFFIAALILTGALVFVFEKVFKNYKLSFEKMNFFIILGQLFDLVAVCGFIFMGRAEGIKFSIFLGLDPFLWVVLKIIFVLLFCWILDKFTMDYINKKNFFRFLKLVVGSIGFLLAVRNLILLGL